MKFAVGSIILLAVVASPLAAIVGVVMAIAPKTQEVTLRFAAKVDNNPFSCGSTYRLGKPATEQKVSDFRFYVSEVALVDNRGKTVPVTLMQDGKWQYQNVALLDFENKTGACTNGTTETRDRIVGTVPKGNYTGLKFTLGVPFELNHEDSTLAPSPLNLTGLWWNWQSGYKFARIDLQASNMTPMDMKSRQGHGGGATGFLIHLGSTGCQAETTSLKATNCDRPNRAIALLTRYDPAKNVVVADLAQLVASSNLNLNQPKTSPGCMSESNDRDCMGIMTNLGLSSTGKPAATQTFFRVE